jgi:hypothetical protein
MMTETETHGLVDRISERLVKALPPAFLVLVLLNIGFLAMATWVFSHNSEQRNVLLTRIVESCLTQKDRQ